LFVIEPVNQPDLQHLGMMQNEFVDACVHKPPAFDRTLRSTTPALRWERPGCPYRPHGVDGVSNVEKGVDH
jgi:hypothetical protein